MPELPEVETVRLGLERAIVGRTVTGVEVSGSRTVRRQARREFVRRVTGRRVLGVTRRGKYLLVGCDGGTLVVHLRMTGRLRIENDPRGERTPHTHAVFSLDDGRELHFVDPRTFGELFFALPGEALLDEVIGPLGPDALRDAIDPGLLGALVARRSTTLKAFLLDQGMIAGVGNIYADEICFAAGLRPDRRTDSLGPDDLAALARALRQVIDRAVELGGTSLGDGSYRDLFGQPGSFQSEHAVYGRDGEPCPRCGLPIAKARVAGRATHFCLGCQR
ncbi:MAG TPA: bifunctional DNA-formamidopyrimidine glycosylase/DNA-(apurinic or apyrimidinic site) lyase [Acidimicrobiales bacterium]|nr:bifunctional DNA-formamidopyrimidine glycosylase/DNA-(apurinic or apyrimidinic site) lyase [Acidimicrobiales bacterium]